MTPNEETAHHMKSVEDHFNSTVISILFILDVFDSSGYTALNARVNA
jgi:hypothetical protein